MPLNYSSALTTDHPTWTAARSAEPVFYYKAIHLKTLYAEIVEITSDVSVCGFYYNDGFNQDDPNKGFMESDCNDNIDEPFTLEFNFKPSEYRILVVSSRRRYETKSFTITVDSMWGGITFERLTVIKTTTIPLLPQLPV